jgi:FkbM family methyltransferase
LAGIRRRTIETALGEFYVDPVSTFGLSLLEQGVYEPRTVEALRAFLGEGATFLDLGANEAYFSVIASKLVGGKGRVYAVEPQDRLQSVAARNLEVNGAENAVVSHCAISDRNGQADLFLAPDTNTGSSAFQRATKYRLATQSVKTVTLETFLASEHIDLCDVMKIDIEGHEYEAIMGSPDVFVRGRVRAIILQLHASLLKDRGLNTHDISDLLTNCGYVIDPRFPEAPTVWVWSR